MRMGLIGKDMMQFELMELRTRELVKVEYIYDVMTIENRRY